MTKNSAELEGPPSRTTRRAEIELVDAIWPVLNEIIVRLGQGRRLAVDEAANLGNEAIRCSRRIGNAAVQQVATGARIRPFAAIMVTVSLGFLMGIAVRRG